MSFAWMAWTWPTASFFLTIFLLLLGMGVWEYVSPGGNPRVGVLRFETTRGDRLFFRCLAAPLSTSPGWGSSVPICGGLSLSPWSTRLACSATFRGGNNWSGRVPATAPMALET